MSDRNLGFYEFFAGGGMAQLGLGDNWRCLMANDISGKKAQAYQKNFWPGKEYIVKDVSKLLPAELPGNPVLAWASFPCQDLSLAGQRRGLAGERSSVFWPFWKLIKRLRIHGRRIPIVVLENVPGAITSHGGADFEAILEALLQEGYRAGALVVDAAHFVPQSRPRLFIIAVLRERQVPTHLPLDGPSDIFHPILLRKAFARLPERARQHWIWWGLPKPPQRRIGIVSIIEEKPTGVRWHTATETRRLLSLMSPKHLHKVTQAQSVGGRVVGTLYKRTRKDSQGLSLQRAEVRFDQIGGCLRTPAGGSSRQVVLIVDGPDIRSRLLSPREAARLMGVPDSYALPQNYNEAYHLMGDGVVVPVVAWIEKHILRTLALATATSVGVA